MLGLRSEADRISERWRQHHTEVLSAPVVSSPYALCPVADPGPGDDADMVPEWRPSRIDVVNILARVDGSMVQMGFLPLSYVQEGMSCCSTSTASSLPSTKKVIPKIATTGEACVSVTTPVRFSSLFWLSNTSAGSDILLLTLLSFLDVTRLHGHSSAVLYLDLSRAFDLAIREAILGVPESLPEDRHLEHLCDIGLAEENI